MASRCTISYHHTNGCVYAIHSTYQGICVGYWLNELSDIGGLTYLAGGSTLANVSRDSVFLFLILFLRLSCMVMWLYVNGILMIGLSMCNVILYICLNSLSFVVTLSLKN